jgi:hypothetical protein
MTQLMLFSVRSSNLPDSVVSHRASIVENLGSAYYDGGGADVRSGEIIKSWTEYEFI